MKIWLDDIRPNPASWWWAKDRSDVRNLFDLCRSKNWEIEVMSFDHDLGDDDGYEIIKWMSREYLDLWPKKILVHSANPVGKENITQFDRNVRLHAL